MAIESMSYGPNEVPEPDPARPADKPPGRPSPDQDPEKADQPPRAATPDKDPKKAELTRAVGELAAENADLYRKNADLDKKVTRLEAELETEKARHTAWAVEVARDRGQTAKRLEEQTKINEQLAGQIAELRDRLAEKSVRSDAGRAPKHFEEAEAPEKQATKKNPDRLRLTNEVIGVVVT
jgi:predicted RNase H-like nuclease (RuvC/YqgF family)